VFGSSQVEVKFGESDCKLNKRVGLIKAGVRLTRIHLGNAYGLLNLPADSIHFLRENTSEFVEYFYFAVRMGAAPLFLPVQLNENGQRKEKDSSYLWVSVPCSLSLRGSSKQ